MSKVEPIHENRFAGEVIESSIPVVVDFYATWCPPCKVLAPVLDRLAGEFAGRVKFVKVNVDEDPGLAAEHGIRGVPTLMLFRDGSARETIVGLIPPQSLVAKLDSLTAGVATPAAT